MHLDFCTLYSLLRTDSMCAFLRDGCFVHCTVGMAARRSVAACGETCGWRAMVRAARRAALCATDFAAAAKGVRRYCAVPHKALPRTRAQHTGQHKVLRRKPARPPLQSWRAWFLHKCVSSTSFDLIFNVAKTAAQALLPPAAPPSAAACTKRLRKKNAAKQRYGALKSRNNKLIHKMIQDF